MITCTIAFYGSDNDDHGIPKPYHTYLIVASEWLTENSGIATIVPLTEAPTPTDVHYPVQIGGPKSAIEKAIKALEAISDSSGLGKIEDYSE